MMRFFSAVHVFLAIFLASCVTKLDAPKDPCLVDVFLKDIDNYSRSELLKLVRILESSSYGSQRSDGCKDALLGKVYFALERMSKASDYFSLAAKKLPELSHYFLLAKAHAEFNQDNYNQATTIAQTLLESSARFSPQFALKVRKILADIAVKEKDNQQIIKTHQTLLAKGFSENEALLFNLATALNKAGEYKQANDVYRKLLIMFPTSEGARRIEHIKTLGLYNLELKDIEKRFDKLIENLAFSQVVKDADTLLDDKSQTWDEQQKSQIASIAVKSLIFNNQFAQALTRSRARAEKKHPTAKDLESHAFALAKVGHFMDAADFYGRMTKTSTDKDDQAKGCFFRGFSLYEANLYAMALFAWQSCGDTVKNTNLYENYLWYQALAFMLQGHYSKAHSLLVDARSQFKNSDDTEKYTYFIGYCLQQLHKKSDYKAEMVKLAEKPVTSYYAQLARQTLAINNPKCAELAADALKDIAKNSSHIDNKNALLLFYLGFKDEARDVILRSSMPRNDKLALFQLLGFYNEAYKRAPNQPISVNKQGELEASSILRALFPVPHHLLVDEICKKYSLNKNLMYAIMKTESSFSESAVSPRGAKGLMQMMPFVAKDLATHLSLDSFEHNHLTDPRTAIELGALLLATLKRQFNDDHLVVASYNAGAHQVQKWINLFGYLPTELFIERIPFKQTRDYVKKVMHTESLYHALNGQELRLRF